LPHSRGAARAARRSVLDDRFDIEHTTLQVDHEGGELLDIELPEERPSGRRNRD
jgi:cobalt-zinc-cadmium efflux system protein